MNFRAELEEVINKHSMENGSDTPDHVLSGYLTDCLKAFDAAVVAREKWYGRKPTIFDGEPPAPPSLER